MLRGVDVHFGVMIFDLCLIYISELLTPTISLPEHVSEIHRSDYYHTVHTYHLGDVDVPFWG